jgi:predicted nicotinamide N-methyase
MPYWAELWPSALALARALPARLEGVEVLELGCGLGIPSLVAAARGARVTSLDWAAEAVELVRRNAGRNGLELDGVAGDWRGFTGTYDLVLGADLLYEARHGRALLTVLPELAPQVLLAEPGRPYAAEFLRQAARRWIVRDLGDRVYSLSRKSRRDPVS